MHDTSRLEKRKVRIAARGIAEQRRWRRVPLPLNARLLLETGRETGCQIIEISAGGLSAKSPLAPRVGSRIVMVAPEIGRIDLDVVRVGHDFFSAAARVSSRKRDRLADLLTWMTNRTPLGLNEERIARRIVTNQKVTIVFQDGVSIVASILDASEAGLSVASEEPVKIGEIASVAGFEARVTRLHEKGFALIYADAEESALQAADSSAQDGESEHSPAP